MRLAIVQHEESVPPGLIANVLDGSDVEAVRVHAWQRDPAWPLVDEIDALVVLGGTMNVDQLDEYPMLRRSRSLMADAMKKGIPTLGVCLGSQMMARVLGSDVRRADPRNALFSHLDLTAEGVADPLVGPFEDVAVLQFHEDTFSVPEAGVPLATSTASGLAQAFRYGDKAYAIQFHFEVDRKILEGWLTNIGRRELLDDWGCSEADLVSAAERYLDAQTEAGTKLVKRFISSL